MKKISTQQKKDLTLYFLKGYKNLPLLVEKLLTPEIVFLVSPQFLNRGELLEGPLKQRPKKGIKILSCFFPLC